MDDSTQVLQGTLDLLILKAISLGPAHGYGILLKIQQLSGEALLVPQGSLYPALRRLERRRWIRSEWGESTNRRRAKYYSLTPAGRDRLRAETERWECLSRGVGAVLAAPGEA